MRSPCSPKIVKLRERNRVLLDQLESNSVLLERRLKKLKRFARTVRYSDKSWQALPPSPLKRKYESWKTRNYSGQVSAAVNASLYLLSSSSSDVNELETKCRQNVEGITSPAKRIKQNSPVMLRPKNKETQLCECCQSPLKSSTATGLTNLETVCEDCYCESIAVSDTTNSDITSQDSEVSMPSSRTGSSQDKHKESPELHSSKYNVNSGAIGNEQPRRTLQAAHAIINYSPESVFLQRLKEKSQAVGDSFAPGRIRRTSAKSKSLTPPQKLQRKTTKFTKPSWDKFSPPEPPYSVRHSSDHDTYKLTSGEHQQHTSEQSPHRSPYYKDELEDKKNRKHVCHGRQCYQQNNQAKKRFPFGTKAKEEAQLVDEGPASPGASRPSSYRCRCDGSTKVSPPKLPLIASDIVAGLVDNEHDKKHIRPGCCCGKGSKWFHELNEYRQLHWFDCHAHPYNACTSEDNPRNLVKEAGLPTGHKCVHRYVLDDRLFARPLYSDHQNNSRCVVCHLPYTIFKSRYRDTPVITLPSALPDPEIQVSVPVGSPHGTRPSVSGNILSYKKVAHPSARGRGGTPGPRSRSQPRLFTRTVGDLTSRAPPPADSWALRYQKGVSK